jgi:hypothetical protein
MFARIATLLLAALAFSTPALAKEVSPGQAFVLRDVSTSDAYYASRATMAGLTCVAGAEGLSDSGDGYVSGAARCSDGLDYYFFQALVEVPSAPAQRLSNLAPARVELPPLPASTLFTVSSIHPEDAYFSSRSGIEGLICASTGALTISVPGTPEYGGAAVCSDGQSYYFYRAAVTVLAKP